MVEAPEHGQPHTERHEHHIYQEKNKWDWALEVAIALMVLGTLIATSVAAYWTGEQWKIADQQLTVSRDTEQRQLRAYLYVDHGSLSPVGPVFVPGSPIGAIIHLHSAGATPAYKLRLAATVEISGFPLPKGNLSDPFKRSGEGITRTNYPILYGNEPINENVTVKFLPEALDILKANRQKLQHYRFYLYGGVRYFDIFGIEDPKLERRYDFCFSFEDDPNSPIKAGDEDGCDAYNKPG